MIMRLASFLTLVAIVQADPWMTTLDQPFNFSCPDGQFLSKMQSAHDTHTHDRQFSFSCSPITLDASIQPCTWSDFVNDYDQPVVFQCPKDGIMTGIYGIHDNSREDRRFRFRCCEVQGFITHACEFTGYRNKFHGVLDYTIRDDWYMRGMESIHDNHQEDRLFQFDICKLDSFYTDGDNTVG